MSLTKHKEQAKTALETLRQVENLLDVETRFIRVLRAPMKSLRFRDYVRLKVGGRDEFSGIGLDQLKALVPEHQMVADTFQGEAAIASCLRWMMRGLPLDKAIRKVRTDLEVAENAKAVKYEN